MDTAIFQRIFGFRLKELSNCVCFCMKKDLVFLVSFIEHDRMSLVLVNSPRDKTGFVVDTSRYLKTTWVVQSYLRKVLRYVRDNHKVLSGIVCLPQSALVFHYTSLASNHCLEE